MTEIPPPPQMPPYAAPYQTPKSNNGKALASMIVGIVSLLLCIYWFLALPGGIVAVALGVISKKEIAAGKGSNSGMATTGIILGAVAAGLALILAILTFTGGGIDAFCIDNPGNTFCENR